MVAPRRAVAVPVSIVVAQQVVAPSVPAPFNGEGLVDRREQVLCQVWGEVYERVEVL